MRVPCPAALNASRYPKNIAIVWNGRSLTWDALNNYVHSTSRYLKEIGIRADARVLVGIDGSPAYVICLLALWRIGVLVCCVDPRPAHEPHGAVELFRPAFVISPRAFRGAWGKDARWSDIEKVVAYGYNDSFLGSEAALVPELDSAHPALARLEGGKVIIQTHDQIKDDPGPLRGLLTALATGGCFSF